MRYETGRFLTALLLGASCGLSNNALAEPNTVVQPNAEPPRVSFPETAGLRPGDMAPSFLLPRSDGTLWDSRDQEGKQSLFLLFDASPRKLDLDAAVAKAATLAAGKGIATVLVSPSAKPAPLPSPITQVVDDQTDSFKAFTTPSFVAIDRAGWLRQIEPLTDTQSDPQNVQLRFLLSQTPDPTPVLAVGKPAPDFSFRDSQGVWRRVSALRGRSNLLLTFFPKCFTGRCQTHLSSLRDNFAGFIALHTDIWAVSVDPAGSEVGQNAFARQLGLPFPMLPDEGRNVCLLYGATKTPYELALRQSVLIDKEGIVRWIDTRVNPETHGEDVLARMAALGFK